MSERILIIDDNQVDQKMMKIHLEKAGFLDIVVADSGEDGLKLAATEKPCLVIVDTLLPGMSGPETCLEIKKLEVEDMKVIVTTGTVDAVDAGGARKAGADDYVVKTVDFSHVIKAVRNAMGRSEEKK